MKMINYWPMLNNKLMASIYNGELYNWTLNNKLKASILITLIDQFYYRLLYDYFDEDY